MSASASRLVTSFLGAVPLGGCVLAGCEASRDGTAFLFNETGEEGLTVEVLTRDGVRLEDGPLEKAYVFDTQWVERELQCYVESDGHFEVLRADGSVLVRHDFADRPVCEREEITLTADGDLVWSS